ncbi:MAG TPA: hypothetical protein VIO94_07345 [Phenylobacterium sp.]
MEADLSRIETEQLRDIRGRLNRVPKGSLGDKSVGPLSKGFFDVCARVGLAASPGTAAAPSLETIAEADMAGLRQAVGGLAQLRADAKVWRGVFDAGTLQAILTRRLVLGGKERTPED